MWGTKLGVTLETFLLSTGTPRHSPLPIPTSSHSSHRALRSPGITNGSPVSEQSLGSDSTRVTQQGHSKAENKPTAPKPSLLLKPETGTNLLLHIWPLW